MYWRHLKLSIYRFMYRHNNLRRLFNTPRSIAQFIIILIIVYTCFIFGVFTHMFEKDLSEFRYPLKTDIQTTMEKLKQNSQSLSHSDINKLNYTFIHKAEGLCDPVKLESNKEVGPYVVILVKSKLTHFKQREVIRETWGKSDKWKLIRTVFLVGVPSPEEDKNQIDLELLHRNKKINHDKKSKLFDNNFESYVQANRDLYRLELEYQKYGDIVQQNFYDTYYNNTLKTLMGIKWAYDNCSNSQYYLFIDDDFYLNPNLLMKYLSENISYSMKKTLYAGFVFPNSSPMRHIISKWYISLKDYPYSKFPAFVAAGCVVLSRESLELFYMASKIIKLFKFDDIYMGIIAYKLDIVPFHVPAIHFYAPSYYPDVYKNEVIAAHGFSPDDIASDWQELRNSIEFQPPNDLIDLIKFIK